jgi:Ca2+-binding RTX toxin-like protein
MRRLFMAASAVAVLATFVGASDAQAANCTVNGTALTFTLAANEAATLRVAGQRIGIAGANCQGNPGAADVSSITVTGSTGAEKLTVTDPASLAPGVGAEPGSTAEIELSVDLGAGNDELLFTGGTGNDTYVAGANGIDVNNDDDADYTLANVELIGFDGGAGNDTLSGGGDASTGGASSLLLRLAGGIGDDSLTGSTRSDAFVQEAGADTYRGGAGADSVSYAAATATVVVTVGSGANDGTVGEKDNVAWDVETVRGGAGNDVLTGTGSRQLLYGNAGNDRLSGGNGNDLLRGGAGNDILTGGAGTDSMFGDAGADRFFALDRVRDVLAGGLGVDRARADRIDSKSSVEGTF